jgi:hypothetical protein
MQSMLAPAPLAPAVLTVNEGLYHVSQINWSDPRIYRAGIVPICKKAGKCKLGFGVSNSSAVIVTIGGAFEQSDGDLLVTAVREYNEETGSSLVVNEVLNCYAVRNKGTINILLPVSDSIAFKPNKELERMLWLTTDQAVAIIKNQSRKYYARRGSVRILTMAQSLINEIPLLTWSVATGLPFIRYYYPFYFRRTYKAPELKQPRVSTNFNHLREDISDPSLFYGSTSLTVRGDYVAFERRDKVIYVFTVKDLGKFIEIITANKMKVYVSSESEVDFYNKFIVKAHIVSIENRINKLIEAGADRKTLQPMLIDFQEKIKSYHTFPDMCAVIWETILIHETEEAIYRATQEVIVPKNKLRLSFWEALDMANLYLLNAAENGSSVPFWELVDYLIDNQKYRAIMASESINTMIELGLITRRDNVITIV